MPTDVPVPDMGESIRDAVILRWMKSDGEHIAADQPLCELETDKATFDLPAPSAGTVRTLKPVGATVRVGEVVARLEEGSAVAAPAPHPPLEAPPRAPRPGSSDTPPPLTPVRREVPVGHAHPAESTAAVAKESREANNVAPPERSVAAPERKAELVPAPTRAAAPAKPVAPPITVSHVESPSGTRRVPMTKIRQRIAERLVRAKQTTAMLTTFNEIDMTAVMGLREEHKEQFQKTHGVSLGMLSFFGRAVVLALKQFPAINAEIDGDEVIYHDYVHLGVAVHTDRGLVVPVLRNAQDMSFPRLESEIKRVAAAARDGKLSLQELSGGTFTLTNGGVFGSLLSTPILNPPQTGILGMHTIQKRAVVINDRIRARPMMYVALSYDHRLVDGHDAVLFLVKLKQFLESPMTMLLDV